MFGTSASLLVEPVASQSDYKALAAAKVAAAAAAG
jgi:hypothetical protein